MVFRNFVATDIKRIEEFSEQLGFPCPDFKKCFFNGIIQDEEGIIAYGQLDVIVEAVLLINQDRDLKTRTQALKRLMPYALSETHKEGFKQLHGFIKNHDFAEIMKKHYNFQPTGGESLVLNL